MIKRIKEIDFGWKFLAVVLVLFGILWFFDKILFAESLSFFGELFLSILPIFVVVFLLMVITDYLITPKVVLSYIEKRSFTKWFFAIVGGILSTGPIYMWYPLMADLKKKGISDGLVACFLYNRAIKIPLLPLIIFYFGLSYVVVLTLVMVFASIGQGVIINKFMEVKK